MSGKKGMHRRGAESTSTKQLNLRLTAEEHAELTRLAKAEGLSMSAFVRKWALAVKGSAQQGYYAKHKKDFPGTPGGVVDQDELEQAGQLRVPGS